MALHDAVIGVVADLVHIVVNVIARKLGYSEIEKKKIEGLIFWLLFSLFIIFLFVLTFKYS